jgi:hypothetical protein
MDQIPGDLLRTEVISFHQHFPPPDVVRRAGGEVNYYIDATYTQIFPAYGLNRTLDERTIEDAIQYERDAFGAAKRVILNQSWALRSVVSDYSLDPSKCAVILPGANYPVYPGLCTWPGEGRPGRERPFVMGFIGKDWRRKGLLFLNQVAVRLRGMGWKVKVRAIGYPASEAPPGADIESLGFIDKRLHFGPFLHSCDVGCLFSSAEAAGSAVLEFLGGSASPLVRSLKRPLTSLTPTWPMKASRRALGNLREPWLPPFSGRDPCANSRNCGILERSWLPFA